MFQGGDGHCKGSAGDPEDTRIPNRWNPVIPFPLWDAYISTTPPALRSDLGAWRCRVTPPPNFHSLRSRARPVGRHRRQPDDYRRSQGQLTKTGPNANDASKATTCKAVIRPPLAQRGATCGMTFMAPVGSGEDTCRPNSSQLGHDPRYIKPTQVPI